MATCTETNVPASLQSEASFFGGTKTLNSTDGYILLVGVATFMSIGSYLVFRVDIDYKRRHSSEFFMTAGRSIKTGLTTSVLVSQWTWAASLLQSSSVAYKFGVSGPFWYAAGASIQVLLFGVLAIEMKRKAPAAHTYLEVIRERWGTAAHLVFLFFALMTNVIVSAMLILGGAAAFEALTTVNVNLTSFLLTWGAILYTYTGGLKATFTSHYLQTAVIVTILVVFVFYTYAGPSKYIGSASAMYQKLQAVSKIENCAYGPNCEYTLDACGPVANNKGGSYTTMISKSGLVFGAINVIGNFGALFLDQSFWQSAIAATPTASVRGFMYGGLCWFAVPFAMSMALGLGAVALQLPLSADEVSAGLVAPATISYMMGRTGTVLLLLQLYMAVISTASGEMTAVASLITYDVYHTYRNRKATAKELLKVSRRTMVIFGLSMGGLSVILDMLGITLGFVYLGMGVLIGSAVLPVAFALTWSKCTAFGAVFGAVLGLVVAVIVWASSAQQLYGAINVSTLGMDYPMLAGNLVAIIVGGTGAWIFSLLMPDKYDWDETKALKMVQPDAKDSEWMLAADMDPQRLNKLKRWVIVASVGTSFLLVVVWPALAVPAGVFSEGYFTLWVAIACTWALVTAMVTIVLPIIEYRKENQAAAHELLSAAIGKGSNVTAGISRNVASVADWGGAPASASPSPGPRPQRQRGGFSG